MRMNAVYSSQLGVTALRREAHESDWHEGGIHSGKVAGAFCHPEVPRAPQCVELFQGLPGCVCVVVDGVQGAIQL